MKHLAPRGFWAMLLALALISLTTTPSVEGSGLSAGSQLTSTTQAQNPTVAILANSGSGRITPAVQKAAISSAAAKTLTVTIDALSNRHTISPYVYGFAYPNSAADITATGATEVRWGGDATSTYNWQLQTNNAAADWYFEDFAAQGFNNGSDSSSTQFITDVLNAGANPLMTMVMLPWGAEPGDIGDAGRDRQLSLELLGGELWPAVQRRSV